MTRNEVHRAIVDMCQDAAQRIQLSCLVMEARLRDLMAKIEQAIEQRKEEAKQ